MRHLIVAALAVTFATSPRANAQYNFARLDEVMGRLPEVRDAITRARSVNDGKRNLAPLVEIGVVYEIIIERPAEWVVRFPVMLPAGEFAAAMGWKEPYAVSGDVHQSSWHIMLSKGPVGNPYGPRIAVDVPSLGRWRVDAQLMERPKGALPNLSAGASPAYDLLQYRANIARLTMRETDRRLNALR